MSGRVGGHKIGPGIGYAGLCPATWTQERVSVAVWARTASTTIARLVRGGAGGSGGMAHPITIVPEQGLLVEPGDGPAGQAVALMALGCRLARVSGARPGGQHDLLAAAGAAQAGQMHSHAASGGSPAPITVIRSFAGAVVVPGPQASGGGRTTDFDRCDPDHQGEPPRPLSQLSRSLGPDNRLSRRCMLRPVSRLRSKGGFQPAMVRAQSRACAVSVSSGNNRRNSITASSLPRCSKARRIAVTLPR